MKAIGLDIGGTAVKYALIDSNMTIIDKAKISTRNKRPEIIVEEISSLIRQRCFDWKDIPVGVCCAGEVDPLTGSVTADNLGWVNVSLGKMFKQALGFLPVFSQDAAAAMYAEKVFGALQGEKSAIFMTIGTGIGGDILIQGDSYRDSHPNGFEIGHMITHANGDQCPCGERGCYERYASASALSRMTHNMYSANDIAKGAEAGDSVFLDIWNRYIQEICIGLVNLLAVFMPDKIVIGGGLSACGEFLLSSILREMQNHAYYVRYGNNLQICLSQFGNDAGVIGAAKVAMEKGK